MSRQWERLFDWITVLNLGLLLQVVAWATSECEPRRFKKGHPTKSSIIKRRERETEIKFMLPPCFLRCTYPHPIGRLTSTSLPRTKHMMARHCTVLTLQLHRMQLQWPVYRCYQEFITRKSAGALPSKYMDHVTKSVTTRMNLISKPHQVYRV